MGENLTKIYSLNIDFLDYEKRKDVTRSIVYSEGDVNTAFAYATLLNGGEILNLENVTVTVGIRNSEGETLNNGCEIVSAQEGKIKIPFSTVALSKLGFNKFEIVIYGQDNKKIVSPTFVYRVEDSVSEVGSIEGSNEYDILLVLISKVQGVVNNANEAIDKATNTENTLIKNEEIRQTNELERISNNLKYSSDEEVRQANETKRETSFNQKITEIDKLSSDIRTELDGKVHEVDTQLTSMVGVFNERVTTVDGKVQEVEDKLIQVDKDVDTKINTKFDAKVIEVDKIVNNTLNTKTEEKFKEVDNTLNTKLVENTKKVDDKILEASNSIEGVNAKIQETTQITNNNTKKVDDKIAEVNIVKTQLINDVNSKIVEINETKETVNTTVSNKMTELDTKFEELKATTPQGEIINSRQSEDGVVHETLDKRLKYDYGKKANKAETYTKSEVDEKIASNTSSIDDSKVALDKTWSSNKTSSEIEKNKQYTDTKLSELIGQSPELLNTLEELSSALGNDPNFATTITTKISEKANKTEVYTKSEVDTIVSASTSIDDTQASKTSTWSSNKINSELNNKVAKEDGKVLSSNDYTSLEKEKLQSLENYVHPNNEMTRHVSDSQISKWDNKAEKTHKHSYSELNDLPTIPSKTSELVNDSQFVTKSQIHTHTNKDVLDTITQAKIDDWNDKPIVDVNKKYVDDELLKKADAHSTYTISEVDSRLNERATIDDNTTTSYQTWSSTKISSEVTSAIANIPQNSAYNKLILTTDWVANEEDGTFSYSIKHDLNSDRIFVSAIDNVTKEGMLVGYKVINKTSILITSTEQFECFLTVVNGDETIRFTESSDTKKNLVFEKTMNNSDWILENGVPTNIAHHNLFTQKLFVSAIDLDTNESIQFSYKILDDSKLKIISPNATHVLVTIINGEREYLHLTKESEINDSIISSGSSWSSKKTDTEIKAIKTIAQESSQNIQTLQEDSQALKERTQAMQVLISKLSVSVEALKGGLVGGRKTTDFKIDGSIEENEYDSNGVLYKTSITTIKPNGSVEKAIRERVSKSGIVGEISYKEYKIITTFNADGSIHEEVI